VPEHSLVDPNHFSAEFGTRQLTGQITALEGGGVLKLRIGVQNGDPLEAGQEGVLTMHDAARFRVVVTERLPTPLEYRVRLLAQERSG
jgi:predicted ATPase with chaperone activity